MPQTDSRLITKAIIHFGLTLAIFVAVASSSIASTRHVIIVDLSKSARSVFPQYRSAIHSILSGTPLNIGDSVTIMGITDDSFGHQIILLQESVQTLLRTSDFELLDCSKFGKGSFQYKSCMATNEDRNGKWEQAAYEHFKRERERFLKKWDDNRIQPYSSTTDVLGALKYAEQLFINWKGKKQLFIFSDMRHNTRGVNLSKAAKVDSRLLDEVKRKELIPRLENVSVFVRGVHTENTDPVYFGSLEQFWRGLFRESGARLEEFSMDSSGER